MVKRVNNLPLFLWIMMISGLCSAPASTLNAFQSGYLNAPAHSTPTANPYHPPTSENHSVIVPQEISETASIYHAVSPTPTDVVLTPASDSSHAQTAESSPTDAPTQVMEATATSSHDTQTPTAVEKSKSTTSSPQMIGVSINPGVTFQTMDGFGATHLSLTYEGLGDVLGPVLRAQAIDAVYNQVHLNLGNLEGALLESPGSYDQRSNDNNNPAQINRDGFQSFDADSIKTNLLDKAQPFGFTDYYISQKINIRWASPWLEGLRSSNYSQYLAEAAEQVAAGSIYWRDQYAIIPPYLMLFNEPLSGNGELLSGSAQEVRDLVKSAGARLEQEGFEGMKLVIPNEETVDKSLDTAQTVLSDADARKYVGIIGYHTYPYGSTYSSIPNILSTSGAGQPDPTAVAIREQLHQLSQQYGLPVWMTEVSHGYVSPISYDDFRGRAIHIHDELLYAQASGYFGMNNMWDTVSQQIHFGNENLFDPSNEGNIVLIDTNQQKVYITGIGYAIGQYARWIHPGDKRVEASSGDPLLQVTAFRSPNSDRLVLVLINNASEAKEIQVDLKTASMKGTISGEQSTASRYWAPIQPFSGSSASSFSANLPQQSVTTFAVSLGSSTPANHWIYIPSIQRQRR